MSIDSILQILIGEILAFLAFFAYPAFLYVSLKRFSRREGHPELWYLPDYGFRLVIRNIPGKRVLSNVRFGVRLRKTLMPSHGASVSTETYASLVEPEDVFFLFPRQDLLLLQFSLDTDDGDVKLSYISKQEKQKKRVSLSAFDDLVCDFSAAIQNPLNFDITIAKRVELSSTTLFKFWEDTSLNKFEKRLPLDNILDAT